MFRHNSLKAVINVFKALKFKALKSDIDLDDDQEKKMLLQEKAMFMILGMDLLGCIGPKVVDVAIYDHALGLYDKDKLKEMGFKRKNDYITVGKQDEIITEDDIIKFFKKLKRMKWVEGRSYCFNSIGGGVEKDRFIVWDS